MKSIIDDNRLILEIYDQSMRGNFVTFNMITFHRLSLISMRVHELCVTALLGDTTESIYLFQYIHCTNDTATAKNKTKIL